MLGRGGRPGLIGMAARTAVVSGTATAVSGRVARRQQERYAQQDVAPAEAAPGSDPDLMAQLSQLTTLHQRGALTDAEFSAAKAKLLS